jgi:hypothetical protein
MRCFSLCCLAIAPGWAFILGSIENSSLPTVRAGQGWRGGSVSEDESKFIKLARDFAEDYKVQFAFMMCCDGSVWEHLVPIFHILPGKILLPDNTSTLMRSLLRTNNYAGLSNSIASSRGLEESDIIYHRDVFGWLKQKPRHVVLHTVPESQIPNMNFAIMPGASDRFFLQPHGYDDDHLWDERSRLVRTWKNRRFPSVWFSNFLQTHALAKPQLYLNELPNFDKSKKTVLYLSSYSDTCHYNSFLSKSSSRGTCKTGYDGVVEGLNLLTKNYNVIVRPHPRVLDEDFKGVENFQKICSKCIIDDYKNGFSIGETAKLSDVVVIEPSSMAFQVIQHAPEAQILLMLKDEKRYACIKDTVMNDDMATIYWPDAHRNGFGLLKAVDNIKRPTPEMVKARKEWFQAYQGDIDGFEEYRVVLQMFRALDCGGACKDMQEDITNMEELLGKFSNISARKKSPVLYQCHGDCCPKTRVNRFMDRFEDDDEDLEFYNENEEDSSPSTKEKLVLENAPHSIFTIMKTAAKNMI